MANKIEFTIHKTSFALLTAAKVKAEEFGWKYVQSFTEFSRENAKMWEYLFFCNDWSHAGKDYPRGMSLTNASGVHKKLSLPQDWDEFCKLIEENAILTKLSVKLNDDYTAEVTKKSVKVGCQTFSHAIVKKLYEASVKMQEK